MQKEILHILRDKGMFSIVLVAPFFMTLIVSSIYIKHKVTEIPIVVYDQDKTDISRMIIRAFEDSERLKIVKNIENYDEMKMMLDSQKAHMAVVIPPNLKKNIKSGRSADVGIIMDGSNILITNTIANASSQIIQTLSGGITVKVIEGYGVSPKKAYESVTALNFRTRTWYNPTTSYLVFMILGLIGTIIQQTIFLGTAISIIKERERGSWNMLIVSGVKWYELMIGKFLTYYIVFTFDIIILYYIALNMLPIPMNGNISLVILTLLIFTAAIVFLGIVFSLFCKNSIQGIQNAMIIAVPSFMLSGFTWPIMAMPEFVQKLSHMLPLTYFLNAIKMETIIGAKYEYVSSDIKALLLFMVIGGVIAAFAMKSKYKLEKF